MRGRCDTLTHSLVADYAAKTMVLRLLSAFFVGLFGDIFAERKLFIGPIAPVIGGIGLGNLAIAEHQTDRAAIGLEDTRAEVNVCDAHEHRQEKEDVVHKFGNENRFGCKVNLAGAVGQESRVKPQDHAGDGHEDTEDHKRAVSQTLR